MPKKSIEEMAAKINLKPCPICRNPMPEIYGWPAGGTMIECWEDDYHHIQVYGDTLEEAAERWNGIEEGGMKGIIDEQIHPCRGCEDYVPENGCKSNGGCGAQMEVEK